MSDPMALKWCLVDLLRVCDVAHEGRLHDDLARIAARLGVELTQPVSATPPLDEMTAVDVNWNKAKKAARNAIP